MKIVSRRSMTRTSFIAVFLLLVIAPMVVFLATKEATIEAKDAASMKAGWNPTIEINARGRGNPWINVSDGRQISGQFNGPSDLKGDFENGVALSRSIATADFDEDGTPDIVSGYAARTGGAISFMRGNVDSIYPNSSEAKMRLTKGDFTNSPFRGPARLASLRIVPDFLGAGDFDADGHLDIAAASRSENVICFFKGDGHGGFEPSKEIELPGNITALLADDINRRDGLNDLAIGVQAESGSQLVILEDPFGAIKASPEIFTFKAPISSLALDFVNPDQRRDLAIAAGNELAILSGRDRKLLIDRNGAAAEPPRLSRTNFAFDIAGLAIGDFIKERHTRREVALLGNDQKVHLIASEAIGNLEKQQIDWKEITSVPLGNSAVAGVPIILTAQISTHPVDTLVISWGSKVLLMTSDIAPQKQGVEAKSYASQRFDMATSFDSASRAVAILPMRLNSDGLSDLVIMGENSTFPTIVETAPSAVYTVTSTAPDGDDNVGDGVCQSTNGECTYTAAYQESQAAAGSSTINFNVPGTAVPVFHMPGLFYDTTVTIDGTTQPVSALIQVTGIDASEVAVHAVSGNNNVFRGMVVNGYANFTYFDFRIVPATTSSKAVESARTRLEAHCKTAEMAACYSLPMRERRTIWLAAQHQPHETSYRSEIAQEWRSAGGAVGDRKVQGNYFGTDVSGNVALGNWGYGIEVLAANSIIGGTTAGAGNVISATNYVGLIYGNGIELDGSASLDSTGILVQGNLIGTNADGNAALGNSNLGIGYSAGSWEMIGGVTPTARNVISGNGSHGVYLSPGNIPSSVTSYFIGNLIGTNATGDAAIPNGGYGVSIDPIGSISIQNNVISGNSLGGIEFYHTPMTSPLDIDFSENHVGTDASGTVLIGNGGDGITLRNIENASILYNVIAGNGGNGISVLQASVNNRISSNKIYDNGGLGIDLAGDGVTLNDPGDPDTGPNRRQNFPVLTSADQAGNISGNIDSLIENQTYPLEIEFFANSTCDANGYGEGQNYLGATSLNAPGAFIYSVPR